jgi:hypothetical protein
LAQSFAASLDNVFGLDTSAPSDAANEFDNGFTNDFAHLDKVVEQK